MASEEVVLETPTLRVRVHILHMFSECLEFEALHSGMCLLAQALLSRGLLGSQGCRGCLQSLSHWRKSTTLGVHFQSCLYISPETCKPWVGPAPLQDLLGPHSQIFKKKTNNKRKS